MLLKALKALLTKFLRKQNYFVIIKDLCDIRKLSDVLSRSTRVDLQGVLRNMTVDSRQPNFTSIILKTVVTKFFFSRHFQNEVRLFLVSIKQEILRILFSFQFLKLNQNCQNLNKILHISENNQNKKADHTLKMPRLWFLKHNHKK